MNMNLGSIFSGSVFYISTNATYFLLKFLNSYYKYFPFPIVMHKNNHIYFIKTIYYYVWNSVLFELNKPQLLYTVHTFSNILCLIYLMKAVSFILLTTKNCVYLFKYLFIRIDDNDMDLWISLNTKCTVFIEKRKLQFKPYTFQYISKN